MRALALVAFAVLAGLMPHTVLASCFQQCSADRCSHLGGAAMGGSVGAAHGYQMCTSNCERACEQAGGSGSGPAYVGALVVSRGDGQASKVSGGRDLARATEQLLQYCRSRTAHPATWNAASSRNPGCSGPASAPGRVGT